MSEKNITTQYLTKKGKEKLSTIRHEHSCFFAKILNIPRGWKGVLIIITIVYSSM